VWVQDEKSASGQDALAFAAMVTEVNDRRRPIVISVDPGGGGMKTILTVRKVAPGIPIKAAEKPPIPHQVRAVNLLAQSGRLRVRKGSQLGMELMRATWRDGLVGSEINEHGPHSDLVPCLRYAALAATPYLPALDARPDAAPVAERKAEWAEVVKQARRAQQKTAQPLAASVLGARRFGGQKRPF
jgi:hypothetical protein